MTSYWYGNSFMSIKGAPLYQSVSHNFKNPDYLEQYRKLLIFRLSHDVKIFDNFYLTSRFEPFFDPNNDNFEFSHSFYLNYRTDFYLFKVKNRRNDYENNRCCVVGYSYVKYLTILTCSLRARASEGAIVHYC